MGHLVLQAQHRVPVETNTAYSGSWLVRMLNVRLQQLLGHQQGLSTCQGASGVKEAADQHSLLHGSLAGTGPVLLLLLLPVMRVLVLLLRLQQQL